MGSSSPRGSIDNLCPKCQAIDLPRLLSGGDQEHHLTFEELSASSQSCGLCTFVRCAAVEQENFVPDDKHSIRLAVVKTDSGALRFLQFRLPSIENRVAGNVTKGGCVVKYINLEAVSLRSE